MFFNRIPTAIAVGYPVVAPLALEPELIAKLLTTALFEVLYNVAPESRLRADYWRSSRAEKK